MNLHNKKPAWRNELCTTNPKVKAKKTLSKSLFNPLNFIEKNHWFYVFLPSIFSNLCLILLFSTKKNKSVWVNIRNRVGQFERISAFEGESLLAALQRNNVAGIVCKHSWDSKMFSFVFLNFLFTLKKLQATCEGGEDINSMLEKPIDPVTYGPFCSSC